MRNISRIIFFSFFCILCLQKPVRANEVLLQSLQESMKQMQQSMQSLQSTVETQNEIIRDQAIRINALETSGVSPHIASVSTVAPGRTSKIQGLSQGFNPDIGIVGNVQAHLTEDSTDGEGRDTIALKELELSIAQYVDPFSRMDAIIAFNDNLEAQNVDIEEAYYTHWGLPLGFQGQIGKFRSKIGKQNLLHLHFLDTVDYPLVIQDFFGEEGLSSSGVRLQNMVPNPWDIPVELTGEVLRGNNGTSFSGISRRPIFNTHVKTFFETTADSNLELGWTTLFSDENPMQTIFDADGVESAPFADPKGRDHYGVKVFGADVTWNWLLSEGRELKWQNEMYFQNRGSNPHPNKNPWGFYTLLDYRFSPRFSTGVRFDYLEPLDVIGEHGQTTAVSPYITFWQSEFAYFRLQYSHTDPAAIQEKSDDAIYLQANFLIGADKHPVQ